MNSDKEIEDETLGRWLNGELSDSELEAFKATESYLSYKAISDISDTIESFDYDTSGEYQKLKTSIDTKKPKVVKMSFYAKLAVAAGIALVIGIGAYFVSGSSELESTSISVATAKGDTKQVVLKDKSELTLNISSSIEYDESQWDKERRIKMTGEVYFKVSKGKPFIVNTNHGNIEVLGTQFNIRNRQNTTEIVCYKGKVRVSDLTGNETILTKGMATRIIDGSIENDWLPEISKDAEWKNGSSSFHKVQFKNVIEELENQYKIEIDCKADISARWYVGAFPHDNLEQALKLVFDPMDLTYTIKDDRVIVNN